ncbi:MAG: glycoside hydrolase family 3 N-terminal domain-containing protein [Bacteroidia bacterium]|nr:glycoside hydrolase family 3 N-terminal domain-containing protein [Bacteroidia bacterium]
MQKNELTTTESRIQSLLSAMSLAEKIGQMTQITHSVLLEEVILNADGSPGDDFSFSPEKATAFIQNYHIGSFLNGIAVSAETWYAYSYALQEINLRINRQGIPIIYGIDHMHGANYLDNSTIFPHNINLAATFEPAFAAEMARITGVETADLGHHWIFAPVLDVGRDPRFPRYYETFGEDPLVCAIMGAATIRAIQENPDTAPYRQVACAKHFLGYSVPKSGWDRTPAEIPDQVLYEYFIPPFRAAVKAGVKTFMINGAEINGVPVHASRHLLTEVLREQLGFTGVVVTDWEDVIRLHTVHKVAPTPKEAVRIALEAGIDMSMTPFTTDFCGLLHELVEDGTISPARIDESVARILRLKLELGLFDNPWPRNDRFDRIKTPAHIQASREAARESLVLLKNEQEILPLAPEKTRKLVVCGPHAHQKKSLAGGWTLRWIPLTDEIYPEDMDTVFSGLQKMYVSSEVILSTKETLKKDAEGADAVIVVIGEDPYSEGSGNLYDLTLESEQQQWIRDAHATGKPVVGLMLSGRPRVIREVYPLCQAFVWAGLPGFEGAQAIAELIAGKINPCGKLPFSWPAWPGHFYPYDHRLMDLDHYRGLSDQETHTAKFGEGLSYTTFSYSDLRLSSPVLSAEGEIVVTVKVKNTGKRAGKETVLWYITDEYASITRPVKQLKYFERLVLEPGEEKISRFIILPNQHLTFPDSRGNFLLEAGSFLVKVEGQEARFELKE